MSDLIPDEERDVVAIAQDVLRGYGHDAIADALARRVSPVTREALDRLDRANADGEISYALYSELHDLVSLSVSPSQPVQVEVTDALAEWADYFERFDSTVGAPKLTGELVAKLLRGPKPFGCAAGVPVSPESEGKK